MYKLSIILPVYNVEKYLDRCIQSILEQNIESYEILLVNDGSKDSSGEICDDYANKYDHIRVIHKANEGLGLTRNVGIQHAQGEHILFVDSDDFIRENALKVLLDKIDAETDVCFFKRSIYDDEVITDSREDFDENLELSSKDLMGLCLGEPLKDDPIEIGPAWKAIYRLAFLKEHDIKFKSERECLSEDYIFSAKVCKYAKCVKYLNKDVYTYCNNSGSLTNSYRKDRYERAAHLYQLMREIINENELSKEAENRAYNNFLINLLVSFKHISFFEGFSMKEKLLEIKKICNNDKVKESLQTSDYVDNSKMKLLKWLITYNQYVLIYVFMLIRYRGK